MVQTLSDTLAQRLQQNNQVTTNNPTVNSQLAGSYYSGTQTFATQDPAARLAQTGASQSQLESQVSDIMAGKIQQAQIAKAQAAAKAALAAQKAAIAKAGKQSYSYSTGLTSAQKRALSGLAGNSSSALYASNQSNNSGAIKVVGNSRNTSGAAGALGGVTGSGTYQYVYNTKLDAQRNAALSIATSYLGTPYVLGGESHTAMDCSGLVQLVYSTMGFNVPTHSAADQGARATGQRGGAADRNSIPGVKTAIGNLQPGDLIAWNDGSHIAIFAGFKNGQPMIIESANPTRGTILRPLWAPLSAVSGLHVTFPGEQTAAQAKTSAIRSKQAQLR